MKCDLNDMNKILMVVIVNVTDKCNNNHHNKPGWVYIIISLKEIKTLFMHGEDHYPWQKVDQVISNSCPLKLKATGSNFRKEDRQVLQILEGIHNTESKVT